MFARAITAIVVTLCAMGAAMADWPEKPVRLIVPYPAGGAADLPARIMSEGLQRKLGKPVIIENRAGAAGQIGTEYAVRAQPDGYTFYCGPNAPYVLLPLLRKTSYTAADLVPVAPFGELIYGLGVLKDFPANNLKELQAYAKSNPDKLSYSSPGAGSATHLRMEVFNSMSGTQITHIPYRSGAEAIPDVLEGRLSMMHDNIFFPQLRLGQMKMVGVLSGRRHPEFPDVQTFAEQGFAIDLPVYGGIFAPVGTPQPIIDAMAKAANELNAEAETIERQLKIGWLSFVASPAEFSKQVSASAVAYKAWVEKLNFKLE